jgi:uncharacterized protein YgiM (DUF1202 family)
MRFAASTLKNTARWAALGIALAFALSGCNLTQGDTTGVLIGAPIVRLVSPQPNATYLEGVAVNISAQITNAGADIDRVEVGLDGAAIATLTQPNTTNAPAFNIVHTWNAAGIGSHTISVAAFRADGSSSEPAIVTINVRTPSGQDDPTDSPTTQAQSDSSATARPSDSTSTPRTATQTRVPPTPRPTNTSASRAAPTATAGVNSAGAPTASFADGINVRRGPGTNFTPPIGVFTAGQSTEILSLNLDGTWYKVRYGGGEGWVYAPLTTVTGSTDALPREAGPPTPLPPTATQPLPIVIPATATTAAASNVNLVVGIVELDPSQPVCGETFVVGLDVANLGSAAASLSGTVSLRDVRAADGSTQGETTGGYPALQAGQTFRVTMPITISTWYEEDHRLIMTVDPQNQIPETDDTGDNVREITYRLLKGSCP